MTCSTSAVAVCCSSASRVSVISRAFSIAMTACAAKFCKQRDLLVGERPDLLAVDAMTPEQHVVLAQRHGEQVRMPPSSTVLAPSGHRDPQRSSRTSAMWTTRSPRASGSSRVLGPGRKALPQQLRE